MNDQMPAIWDTLATALHALGREDEAFAALQAAIRLPGSDDPRIQLHWAKTLHRRGDTAGARAAAEKAHAERLKLDEPQREELRKLREALP